MITALAAALLLTMGQASAGEALIERPVWVRLPSREQVDFAYPAAARHAGRPVGTGTISCRITKDGTLENCVIYKEDPAGLGFGEAALKVAKYFRMKPLSPSGKSVEGGVVTIPLVFRPSR